MPLQFRPRLIPTVAAMVTIALTLHLAQWQAGREQEKIALQELLDARSRMPPHALGSQDRDGEALRYRKVVASGEYVADKQVYLDNKDRNGAVGYHVMTPLKLADAGGTGGANGISGAGGISGGGYVMVNRGWIARGREYPRPPAAVPPVGKVEVSGTAVLPSQRFLELSSANVQGSVWQNFTFDRARSILGLDVLPVIVLAAQTSPDLAPLTETPNAGADKHRGYAFQWLALAVAVFIVWIVVNFKLGSKQS